MHWFLVQAVTSPTKDTGAFASSMINIKRDSTAEGPFANEPSQGLCSLIPGCVDDPNDALIQKLLESLHSLKTCDSREDSGATSPSPLTVSTGGSSEPIPSTPTDYEVR